MPLDTAEHYQYYPFINMGHYALYDAADFSFQDSLSAYYKDGIESCLARAEMNPYGIGVPFIWCSNNLLTSLIAQVILYEHMTGDDRYAEFLLQQRDWLFGRNPWGLSPYCMWSKPIFLEFCPFHVTFPRIVSVKHGVGGDPSISN